MVRRMRRHSPGVPSMPLRDPTDVDVQRPPVEHLRELDFLCERERTGAPAWREEVGVPRVRG